MAITTLVKSIQDIMRKDVGVDGDAQRISQLVWLLFLKIFDDKEQEWEQLIKNNPDSISEEQQADYTRVKRIIAYLGTLLDFLSDVNFLDQEKLSEDNFQQIKKAIENRIDDGDAT